MEELYSPKLIQNLNELTELLAAKETVADTLQRVAQLARATIDGCDSAGVTLVDEGKGRTAAATDDFTLKIDVDQYANDEGPCLEAYKTQEVVLVSDFEEEKRWPAFSAAATRDTAASRAPTRTAPPPSVSHPRSIDSAAQHRLPRVRSPAPASRWLAAGPL